MTKELQELIIKAGLVITAVTTGGVGGYLISEQAPAEEIIVEKIVEKPVFNWYGDEGQIVMDVWNEMLAEKYANCETEPDCIITDGVPGVTFEGIPTDEVPEKLKEKLKDYEISVKRK